MSSEHPNQILCFYLVAPINAPIGQSQSTFSPSHQFYTIMYMKKSAVWSAALFLLALFAFATNACKKDDDKVDCSKITGSTFSSNSGKMQAIIANKCGSGTCHGTGGAGASSWTYSAQYENISVHFSEMYESTVVKKTMPKSGSPALTQEELDVFECWKGSGFPK